MKKYILYSFLTIFAFSTASFGGGEDEEDEKDRPSKVLKIRGEEIPSGFLLKFGRPGGLSPQAHVNPEKQNSSSLCSRGTTFYITVERLKTIFKANP
ncbi:MAG: hypothetical protein K2X28_08100 [Alphaproteobacteria bacterium]|nr:hypothetical protein [Alphaproteobacteria bacterium]